MFPHAHSTRAPPGKQTELTDTHPTPDTHGIRETQRCSVKDGEWWRDVSNRLTIPRNPRHFMKTPCPGDTEPGKQQPSDLDGQYC